MKAKITFILGLTLLFMACKTDEEKINSLISESVEYAYPNMKAKTFQIHETKVDSAFAPFDDPVVLEKMTEVEVIEKEIADCDYTIEQAQQMIRTRDKELRSGDLSAFHRAIFEDAEVDREKAIEQKATYQEKIAEKQQEIQEMLQVEQSFCGYKVFAAYSFEDGLGKQDQHTYFFLDKRQKSVVLTLSQASYDNFQSSLKALSDAQH